MGGHRQWGHRVASKHCSCLRGLLGAERERWRGSGRQMKAASLPRQTESLGALCSQPCKVIVMRGIMACFGLIDHDSLISPGENKRE